MATYYLNADTGNDSTGAGTAVSPWLTIAKALTAVSAGDTIFLQNSVAKFTWATAIIPSITIQGQSTTGCILDGAAAAITWTVNSTPTFSNLTFQNASGSSLTIFIGANSGTTRSTFNYCIFTNITLPNDGLGVETNFTFNYCLFYGLTCVSSTQKCLLFYGNESGSGDTIFFVGCTFYTSATGSAQFTHIINGSAGSAVVTVRSCIFVNAGANMTAFMGSGATASATYSDFFGNGIGTSITIGTGCIAVDPLFIDPTNGNFNLQPTSPCIQTGSL